MTAQQTEHGQIQVRHCPERTRYEILLDGRVAGFADYNEVEGRLVFDHTVIDDGYAGRGLATALARGALDDVRSRQLQMVPLCRFIAGWLVKHPGYQDLVDGALLARLSRTAERPDSPSAEPMASPTTDPDGGELGFTAELWLWDARRDDSWTFVTVPADLSALIADAADSRGPRRGFGSVRVHVRIGATSWSTSVFPDSASGCYLLPIKKAVRRAEGIEAGHAVTVSLTLT